MEENKIEKMGKKAFHNYVNGFKSGTRSKARLRIITVYLRHFISVWRHKYFVLLAGLKLGVPFLRLLTHDWTKFTPAEFGRYARYSVLRKGEAEATAVGLDLAKTEYGFAVAWLNHENKNPHHWGYWIPRSGSHAGRPLPMPETYVREMVADWHGASRAYEGHWDISEWAAKQAAYFQMHPETSALVRRVLGEVGYVRTGEPGTWEYERLYPFI